ncbi:hypothetical protein ACFWIA_21245 [Streptomyces sp. NPDC127068]|uniref:hypothetical protein n=1 Tax=Streptomyces sp. NPDC127068 TaxID=3347127 RepID=UPI00364A5FBE
MDWSSAVHVTALYSLIASGLFCAVLIGGAAIAPDSLEHDYPPAIRDRFRAEHGGKSVRGARTSTAMGVLIALLLGTTPVVALTGLHQEQGSDLGFWPGFGFGTALFAWINLVDLLIVDWWLFCTLRPAFFTLPGTGGMPEYRDKAFHWRVLVPLPLLMIPGYGVLVGLGTLAVEALTG